jgi:ankyrin repeat protein
MDVTCVDQEEGKNSSLVRVQIATLLLDHHANIDARDKTGMTPLLSACCNTKRNLPLVKLLLQREADVNAMDDVEVSPIIACMRDAAVMKMLYQMSFLTKN